MLIVSCSDSATSEEPVKNQWSAYSPCGHRHSITAWLWTSRGPLVQPQAQAGAPESTCLDPDGFRSTSQMEPVPHVQANCASVQLPSQWKAVSQYSDRHISTSLPLLLPYIQHLSATLELWQKLLLERGLHLRQSVRPNWDLTPAF